MLLVAACTSPDLSPVPADAEPPYVCDGVPQQSVELILGGESVDVSTQGRWGADGAGFDCVVETGDGAGRVMVIEAAPPSAILAAADAATTLQMLADQGESEPLDLDVPGAGYVYGPDSPTAVWVCDERVLSVELIAVGTQGRDLRADATALLTSMLPWACGGEDAPESTDGTDDR